MKKLLLLPVIISVQTLSAQNVGIGITNPKARLHVIDSNVVFSANNDIPATPGNPPISGAGRRMMWYPDRAAFRAGYVGYFGGTEWDKDSIGNYSIAVGYSTMAKGVASVAMGSLSKASGSNSVAMGFQTIASGPTSTAIGHQTWASGDYSTAMGRITIASGGYSTAMGYQTSALANYSTAMGFQTTASGFSSTAMGRGTTASNSYSTAMGLFTKAKSSNSLVVGEYNDTTATNSLFEVGDGTADIARSNAMTVLQNGNTGLGTINPLARLHVADSAVVFSASDNIPGTAGNVPISGTGRRMMWYTDKAAFRAGYVYGTQWDKDNIGNYSFASGYGTQANGTAATALGNSTVASGSSSTAMGINTIASGSPSTAMGYFANASADFSTAMGYFTNASAYNSTVMGAYTKAKSPYSLVIGQYNDTSATNSLFEIGNGTADYARNNALTVLQNGNVGIGTPSPVSPLSFSNALGDKISFWNSGPSNQYGIGLQGYLLQIYSGTFNDDIAFGYGGSASFTEKMRVKGNGNVGIGTNNPLAKLHVTDNAVVFSATNDIPVTAGSVPITGGGRRMMWYPDKAAFRAGYVFAGEWDTDSIGNYSVGLGKQTSATGFTSTALGYKGRAYGDYSTAMGLVTRASGQGSTSMGELTTALGEASTAIGLGTFANAATSLAMGMYNDNSDNPNPSAIASTDRIFQIGNGDGFSRSNAITVLRNGNIGVGVLDPQQMLSVKSGMNIDQANSNNGTLGNNVLRFGSNSGEAIGSPRSGSTNLFGLEFWTASNRRMVITNAGFVGIGTNNPSVPLCVNGNIAYTAYLGACSDIRYKKDLTSFDHPLQALQKLNGFYYYWKKDEGISAQEVEKLFPEVVMTDTKGYKSVDYGRLTPVLVEAIKEQQQQITAQQKQIDELKKIIQQILPNFQSKTSH